MIFDQVKTILSRNIHLVNKTIKKSKRIVRKKVGKQESGDWR